MRSNRRNATSSRSKLHRRPVSRRSVSPPKTVALPDLSPFIRHFSSEWYPSSAIPNASMSPWTPGLIVPPAIRWLHGTDEQLDVHTTLETFPEFHGPPDAAQIGLPSRITYSSRAREKACVNSCAALSANAVATVWLEVAGFSRSVVVPL